MKGKGEDDPGNLLDLISAVLFHVEFTGQHMTERMSIYFWPEAVSIVKIRNYLVSGYVLIPPAGHSC